MPRSVLHLSMIAVEMRIDQLWDQSYIRPSDYTGGPRDGAKIGGAHGSNEAALEAASVAAALAVCDGAAIQINVPGGPDNDD